MSSQQRCQDRQSNNHSPGIRRPLTAAAGSTRRCRPGRRRWRTFMAEINLDQLGPVDYVVVRFPADKADFSGAMADELKKLTDSGTVRVLDLLIVSKGEDGTVAVAELRD